MWTKHPLPMLAFCPVPSLIYSWPHDFNLIGIKFLGVGRFSIDNLSEFDISHFGLIVDALKVTRTTNLSQKKPITNFELSQTGPQGTGLLVLPTQDFTRAAKRPCLLAFLVHLDLCFDMTRSTRIDPLLVGSPCGRMFYRSLEFKIDGNSHR